MNVARRRGAVAALLAVVALAGIPAYGAVGAAGMGGAAGTSRAGFAAALRQTGARMRSVALAPGDRLSGGPGALAPLASPASPASPADITPTATVTATPVVLSSPVPTATSSATSTVAPVASATAVATATPPPTATPLPTVTVIPSPSPRPPTRTPEPSATPVPPTATPHVTSVRLVAVEVAALNRGREQRVTTANLGATLRLRIVVSVTGLVGNARARVRATWALRGILSYSRDFSLGNGRTALYDDVALPTRGLAVGSYYYTGSIAYRGATQQATTMLHVVGEGIALQAKRVHYAHLRLTVPKGWQLDFQKDSQGRAATGPSSLIMFSPSKRAAVSVVSVGLRSVPSSSDLHAFPALVLQQEFDKVTNVKILNFKSQIDGHDVFAAQADVTLQAGDARTSQALALVTDKSRQLYAFTVVDLLNSAPQSEVQAGLAATLGSKLD